MLYVMLLANVRPPIPGPNFMVLDDDDDDEEDDDDVGGVAARTPFVVVVVIICWWAGELRPLGKVVIVVEVDPVASTLPRLTATGFDLKIILSLDDDEVVTVVVTGMTLRISEPKSFFMASTAAFLRCRAELVAIVAGAVVAEVTVDEIATICCFGMCDVSCSLRMEFALILMWAGENVKCDLVSFTLGEGGGGELLLKLFALRFVLGDICSRDEDIRGITDMGFTHAPTSAKKSLLAPNHDDDELEEPKPSELQLDIMLDSLFEPPLLLLPLSIFRASVP